MFSGNSDQWSVEFETNSRDAFIKVVSILARATSGRVLTRSNHSVLIIGLGPAGKTLVVDAFIAEISDDHTPFNCPEANKTYLEQEPLNGCSSIQKATIFTNKRPTTVEFFNLEFRQYSHLIELKKNASKRFLSGVFQFFSHNEITFISSYLKKDQHSSLSTYAMIIDLEKGLVSWKRSWKIEILSPNLKTKQMRQALDHLRVYESRRQKRMASRLIA